MRFWGQTAGSRRCGLIVFIWRCRLILFILGASGLLTSCSSDERDLAPVTKISSQYAARGAGGSFALPVYHEWAEDLNTLYAAPLYVFHGVGSGEGIDEFIAGEVDFGASDVALTERQGALLEQSVRTIPMTAGLIVVAYNLGDAKVALQLSRKVYHAIFAGHITHWNDPALVKLNPHAALPAEPIQLVVREAGSGLSAALSGHLGRVSDSWRQRYADIFAPIAWPPGALVADTNLKAAEVITSTPNTLGYVDFGAATEMALAMARLENQAGRFVEPGLEAGLAALGAAVEHQPGKVILDVSDPEGDAAYPLVVLSSVYFHDAYPAVEKAKAIRLWIAHGLADEQQETAARLGYLPLPKGLLIAAREQARRVQ